MTTRLLDKILADAVIEGHSQKNLVMNCGRCRAAVSEAIARAIREAEDGAYERAAESADKFRVDDIPLNELMPTLRAQHGTATDIASEIRALKSQPHTKT